jgi:hypothetical protein
MARSAEAIERAQRRRRRKQRADGYGAKGPLLARKMGPQKLSLLRSVNNPVLTSMAGPQLVAPGVGPVTVNLAIQGEIPAGSVLYATTDGNWSTVDNITVDGNNIYTGGPVAIGAVSDANLRSVGIFIPRAIKNNIQVAATATGAGTVTFWLASASLEVEQTLEAAAQCECDLDGDDD